MALKTTLIQCLKQLENVKFKDYPDILYDAFKADDALRTIFKVGIAREQFTTDEKKEIGSLIVPAIMPIKLDIHATIFVRACTPHFMLIKRSALQFLVDDYKDFPVENATLSKKFSEAKIYRSIKILHEFIMHRWDLDICSSDWDVSDSDEDASDSDKYVSERYPEASKVPASHTWWFQ